VLENQFIHDPDASSLDLLPPDRARRYRDFRWHRLDYPGQTGNDRAGPNEARASEMTNELSAIRPERRANRGADAVVTENEFDARMRRYVADELVPVPAQTGFTLNRHAADSFVQMRAAAAADGVDLVIGAASRTPERAAANAARAGNPQAVGRFSSHILGLAVDLNLSYGNVQYLEMQTRPMQNVVDMRESPAHKWMFLRGASYGWYPLQNEPWHWEYNPDNFRDTFRERMNAAAAAGAPANAAPAQRTAAGSAAGPLTALSLQRFPENGVDGAVLPVQRGPGDTPTGGSGSAVNSNITGLGDVVLDAVGSVVRGAMGSLIGRGITAALGSSAAAVTITFGPNAVQSVVSQHSLDILKDILTAAGLTSATITSTARNAADQARAMYDNLQNKGVAHQKALYGPAGDQVIDVYVAAKAEGKSPTQIKAAMEAKITEIGPARVSRHCADPTRLNVFDVGPRSIGDEAANEAFKRAAQAEVAGGRVSNFIPYPKDPGHHFEIVPP
jgi:hypothetical protein